MIILMDGYGVEKAVVMPQPRISGQAGYYGYMWSRVFALDMFETIKQMGLLSPEAGDKLTTSVLGRGGSVDPNILLENFLGRRPNQEAFLRGYGIID